MAYKSGISTQIRQAEHCCGMIYRVPLVLARGHSGRILVWKDCLIRSTRTNTLVMGTTKMQELIVIGRRITKRFATNTARKVKLSVWFIWPYPPHIFANQFLHLRKLA
jgi:hypothetical protein